MEAITGSGHPERTVKGRAGALYLDVDSGIFYYKGSGAGEDTNGWIEAGASTPDHSFADGDPTPDVSDGKRFRTSNATITNFTGGSDGQMIFLIVDRNTTIQQNEHIDMGFVGPGRVNYMLDNGKWCSIVRRDIP